MRITAQNWKDLYSGNNLFDERGKVGDILVTVSGHSNENGTELVWDQSQQ